MTLRMIWYGMLAGFGFLVVLALLERVTRPGGSGVLPGAGEADISEQVWQVLAEARRITEEA